jgi:aspartyl-tRNA(Asn)/glutamyl-tRNA(Gln) amidotransferase subunit A
MKTDLFSYLDSSPASDAAHGALTGKTVVLQPNLCVRGWPADAGSAALREFIALEDATVVERLKNGGAALVGRSRMSELGLGLDGDTTCRILSDGLSETAIMTDMMGEARLGAAGAGVFAFKPTTGLVSRFGLIGLAPSLETCAVLAGTPQDIAAIMNVIAGHDGRDFAMCGDEALRFEQTGRSGRPMKTIGYLKEQTGLLAETEQRAFFGSLERLRESGFAIREAAVPDLGLCSPVHQCVSSVEASSSCGKYDGVRYGYRTAASKNWNDMYLKTRAEVFGPLVKAYLFQGAYFQFENYAAFVSACRIRARIVKQFDGLFAGVDVLAGPVMCKERPGAPTTNIRDLYEPFALTIPANLTGCPAVQIPQYCSGGRYDCGLQLMGPRLSDRSLLSLAAGLSGNSQGGQNDGT